MPIVWSDKLVVGIPEIDSQHREIVENLNQLEQAIAERRPEPEIEEILAFLDFYVVLHFRAEERKMDACSCSAAAANRTAHEDFLRSFTEVRRAFDAGGATEALLERVQEDLMRWLETHIGGVDCRMRATSTQRTVDRRRAA